MPKRTPNPLTVVLLEATQVWTYHVDQSTASDLGSRLVDEWDPARFLTEQDGARLFEELARRIRLSWDETGEAHAVLVSLPGTLHSTRTIISSSRLGIRQRAELADHLEGTLGVPSAIFHDVECLAVGESALTGDPTDHATPQSLVYVFADEGIGSKLIIDGKPYRGAGIAGTIGRLTVQPDGPYFRELAARGTLEVFSSRPWVSQNLVGMFLSEVDKQPGGPAFDPDSRFRHALQVASEQDWRGLTYEIIAEGIADNDPIAMTVLADAARYLGFALNAIMTMIHPHRLVLGGGMISQLPGFADQVINYTRQYSWPLAWNATQLSVTTSDRHCQVTGAVSLWATSPL